MCTTNIQSDPMFTNITLDESYGSVDGEQKSLHCIIKWGYNNNNILER